MKRFLVLSILSVAFMTSCKKAATSNANLGSKSPSELIGQLIDMKADFQINVSSSIGSSVYGNQDEVRGATIVEGYSADERNVGAVAVNDKEIPFVERNYFYQIDSTESPSLFTGRTNTYSLRNGAFPSFAVQNYSTGLTNMTFSGLSDYKLPAGSDLTIRWNADREFPETGKAIVIVSTEDAQGRYTTFYKEVAQLSGEATLSADELSAFDNAAFIHVYFAKGAGMVSQVQGKTIAIENLAYTYARIYR